MNRMDAYRLRCALLNAGYAPVTAIQDGRSVAQTNTLTGVMAMANDHPRAVETAIEIDKKLVVVDAVPLSPAQIEVRRIVERDVRIASQRAHKRAKDRAWIERKRRALGVRPRAEWLQEHAIRPWVKAGMSKSTYYRNRGNGASGG
jgi:hypothetical protein